MGKYRLPLIQSLCQQLLRGPRRLRLRQLLGIEFLLSVVEPSRSYPIDFVVHSLTGFRTPGSNGESRLLSGGELVADLITLAEDLSENADIRAETWPGKVYTVQELATRFDVSTKTVFRWRRRGLTGWKFRDADRRVRLRFPDRCVRRFVARNADLVTRGSNFSQLSPEERSGIVLRATALADAGHRTVNAAARIIASETGRAIETIRLILRHHDEANPGAGIFNRAPIQARVDERHLAVWEAYLDGATVTALAERFGKPIAWVYAAVTQMRARELRARTIEVVPSEEFESPDAETTLLIPPRGAALYQPMTAASRRVPRELPPYLASLFELPLLTRAGEQFLFRKMNYLKHAARRMVERIDPESARAVELDRIEALLEQAAQVKNEVVRANLRLVVSIAKRHVNGTLDLFELISDGNVSLMRSVDKFDYTRGFKFSTYASWAIMKNFARSVPEQRRHHERFQSGWDERLDQLDAFVPYEPDNDRLVAVRGAVDRMLGELDDRERSILRQRFGLDDYGQPRTLEQIGQTLGVSKERIRQLESRAMSKLRDGYAHEVVRLLGG